MRDKRILALICLLGTVFFALTLRGVAGNTQGNELHANEAIAPFESSHERASYALMLSLYKTKSMALTRQLADFASPDVGYLHGEFYSYFPPGIAVLILPFYALGSKINLGQVVAYSVIPMLSILTMIMIYKIGRVTLKIPSWAALLSSLIYAFASTSWSYSITIYQHAAASLFITLSFYAVYKYKQRNKYSFFWALLVWFIYGISLFFDYPNAFLLLPVMIYFFLSSFFFEKTIEKLKINFRLIIIATSVVFAAIILSLGYFNFKTYGGPTKLSNSLPRYNSVNLSDLRAMESGLLIPDKSSTDTVFMEQRIIRGLYILTISPDKGIFFFSPIFVISILGLLSCFKKMKLENVILISVVAIDFMLYASFDDHWGGWAFGPRYLIPAMPILSLYIGKFLSEIKNKKIALISKISTLILFIFSTAVALLGAITTNIIPPKIEADFMHLKYYNYLLNVDMFLKGKSNSFAFNEYFSHFINLTQYYLFILVPLVLLASFILFILPKYEKE